MSTDAKKVASTVAGTVSNITLTADPSQPGIVNGTFTFTLPSNLLGVPAGTVGQGSFSFDESSVNPNISFQAIPLNDFQVTLLGQTFTAADGRFLPTADFFSGTFAGIEYDVQSFPVGFPLVALSIIESRVDVFDQNFNVGEVPIAYSFVEVPPAPITTITGTNKADFLTGTNGPDLISGQGGNDTLLGLAGNDQIFGGSGNDLALGGSGTDTVDGDTGNDQLYGGSGNDIIIGGDGVDVIFGDNGDGTSDFFFGNNDQISGGKGNDQIFGELGDDQINGDDGNDIINAGDGFDFVSGGAGQDRIFGGFGSDQINGDAGNDQINGDSGFDILDGGDGNDLIFGGTEDDTLRGGAGADTLEGGFGSDFVEGGIGDDRLTGIDSLNPGFGVGFGAGEIDTLTGGEGKDVFVLGDATRVYYDDGNPATAGDFDYAQITDFTPNQDTLQVKGTAALYSLDFFTSGSGTINAALIYDPGVTARGELIAVLQNVSSTLKIKSASFKFV